MQMQVVELEAGPIEFADTGGDGPPLVLLNGLTMDWRQWRKVIAELEGDFRCLAPTLPMGAHRRPMAKDADLTLRGMCQIVADFLAALELSDVTVCFNDWCGAQVMIAEGLTERIGRLVLVSCEAYDNYPPGLGGKAAWLSAKLPGGITMMRLVLGRRALRNLPIVFGQLSKHGVPDELMREWLEPLRRREIRRDLRKYAGAAMAGRRELKAASDRLACFKRPVLVVWDTEGAMMPNEHGPRLAAAFPQGRLLELDDCYTLIPEDRPDALAAAIAGFVPAGKA